VLAPDPFGLALHALADEQKAARATRTDGFPTAAGHTTQAPGDDTITISDPDAFVAAATANALQRLTELVHGERNAGLNNVAMSLGHLVGADLLDYDQTHDWLDQTAHDLWPDADTGNVRGTIRSGLTAGMRQPLDWQQAEAIPAAVPFTLPDGAPLPELIPPEDRHATAVATELARQRASREARKLLDQEEAAATFRIPPSRPTLADELKIPPKPVAYAIDELLPAGGNALLTAQYKAGKTSVVNDLLRAYCDSIPFLGRFTVNPGPGRIAVFNYEVGEDQYREWLRALGLQHPERATVLNLRGFRLPVTVPSVEDWVVGWLQDHEVSFWVVDPFARAFTGCGDSENDNSAVGVFLDTLDVIKARAGVRDLVLPTHTGRAEHDQGQERSRGATRLEDWADVRWLLTKGDTEETAEVRFFRATGRDVDVPEAAIAWDETDRSLSHGGGDRKWMAERRRQEAVLAYVADNPGCTSNAVEHAVTGKATAVRASLKQLVASHHIEAEQTPNGVQHRALRDTVTSPSAHGVFPAAKGLEEAA
jgi:hypothetical protein